MDLEDLSRRRNLLAHRIATAVANSRIPAADIVQEYVRVTAQYDKALLDHEDTAEVTA